MTTAGSAEPQLRPDADCTKEAAPQRNGLRGARHPDVRTCERSWGYALPGARLKLFCAFAAPETCGISLSTNPRVINKSDNVRNTTYSRLAPRTGIVVFLNAPMKPVPPFSSLRGFALQAMLFTLLALCCSCAHRPGKVYVSAEHGLRLGPGETFFVSTSSTGGAPDACGAHSLKRMFHAALSALGVPTGSALQAGYELALECRDLPAAPRNQPPLAPGSRLWYQRRFYAPTFAKTNPEPSTVGARQLYLRAYKKGSSPASDRLPLWEAKIRCSDAAEDGIRAAVHSLAEALNARRML